MTTKSLSENLKAAHHTRTDNSEISSDSIIGITSKSDSNLLSNRASSRRRHRGEMFIEVYNFPKSSLSKDKSQELLNEINFHYGLGNLTDSERDKILNVLSKRCKDNKEKDRIKRFAKDLKHGNIETFNKKAIERRLSPPRSRSNSIFESSKSDDLPPVVLKIRNRSPSPTADTGDKNLKRDDDEKKLKRSSSDKKIKRSNSSSGEKKRNQVPPLNIIDMKATKPQTVTPISNSSITPNSTPSSTPSTPPTPPVDPVIRIPNGSRSPVQSSRLRRISISEPVNKRIQNMISRSHPGATSSEDAPRVELCDDISNSLFDAIKKLIKIVLIEMAEQGELSVKNEQSFVFRPAH